jgi:hypothetical protein
MPLTGHVRFGGGLRGKGPEISGTSPRSLPCIAKPAEINLVAIVEGLPSSE